MLFALLMTVPLAQATPRADPVSWTSGGTTFDGFLVYDDATNLRRPGLVMVPNWYGVTDTAVAKAKMIAGTRYVILVADVYGKGVRPKNADEAGIAAKALHKDSGSMRTRVGAALTALKGRATTAPVDVNHLGAIGFCLGGTTVLEYARSVPPDLDAVVSFHAGLDTDNPVAAGAMKVPVLALNGAADSYVTSADIAAFEKEMAAGGGDWQLVQLGGAVHCFTETNENSPTCKYDAHTAARAYEMMGDFFTEIFSH